MAAEDLSWSAKGGSTAVPRLYHPAVRVPQLAPSQARVLSAVPWSCQALGMPMASERHVAPAHSAACSSVGVRTVVLDAPNIAMRHGRQQRFSCRGIDICAQCVVVQCSTVPPRAAAPHRDSLLSFASFPPTRCLIVPAPRHSLAETCALMWQCPRPPLPPTATAYCHGRVLLYTDLHKPCSHRLHVVAMPWLCRYWRALGHVVIGFILGCKQNRKERERDRRIQGAPCIISSPQNGKRNIDAGYETEAAMLV